MVDLIDVFTRKVRGRLIGNVSGTLTGIWVQAGRLNRRGWFNTKDFSGHSTTGAHESGHGLGLLHPGDDPEIGNLDGRGVGQPGIMTPRNSTVDPQYQKDPKAKPGSHPNGTIDPYKRRVTKANINSLHIEKLRFDKNGKAKLGRTNHKIYDANGN